MAHSQVYAAMMARQTGRKNTDVGWKVNLPFQVRWRWLAAELIAMFCEVRVQGFCVINAYEPDPHHQFYSMALLPNPSPVNETNESLEHLLLEKKTLTDPTLISLLVDISLDSERRNFSLGLLPNFDESTATPVSPFTYLWYKNLHSHNKNRANRAHPNINIANVSIVKSPTPSIVHM